MKPLQESDVRKREDGYQKMVSNRDGRSFGFASGSDRLFLKSQEGGAGRSDLDG